MMIICPSLPSLWWSSLSLSLNLQLLKKGLDRSGIAVLQLNWFQRAGWLFCSSYPFPFIESFHYKVLRIREQMLRIGISLWSLSLADAMDVLKAATSFGRLGSQCCWDHQRVVGWDGDILICCCSSVGITNSGSGRDLAAAHLPSLPPSVSYFFCSHVGFLC